VSDGRLVFMRQANSVADRADALICLTATCGGDEENQTLFRRAKGIQQMVAVLRKATPVRCFCWSILNESWNALKV
jgi:hypothetical protein